MEYHDYHLRGYSVRDFGTRLELDLVYDYEGEEKRESRIEFRDVACYVFTHTAGAILCFIEEVDVRELVREELESLTSFANQYGLRYWVSDAEQYVSKLLEERMKAWRLISAIGFEGYVIARDVVGTP